MKLYQLFTLIPLSSALAWQDLKSRQVNLIMAVVTLVILGLGICHIDQSLWIFCVLWLYRYFRKNSVHFIDITLFSLGAGYFSHIYLPTYCLLTAISLAILSKIIYEPKLPFIVAWAIGFWATYFLRTCIN
jgi:hypothetical protein